jgi:hypothetical protein
MFSSFKLNIRKLYEAYVEYLKGCFFLHRFLAFKALFDFPVHSLITHIIQTKFSSQVAERLFINFLMSHIFLNLRIRMTELSLYFLFKNYPKLSEYTDRHFTCFFLETTEGISL